MGAEYPLFGKRDYAKASFSDRARIKQNQWLFRGNAVYSLARFKSLEKRSVCMTEENDIGMIPYGKFNRPTKSALDKKPMSVHHDGAIIGKRRYAKLRRVLRADSIAVSLYRQQGRPEKLKAFQTLKVHDAVSKKKNIVGTLPQGKRQLSRHSDLYISDIPVGIGKNKQVHSATADSAGAPSFLRTVYPGITSRMAAFSIRI